MGLVLRRARRDPVPLRWRVICTPPACPGCVGSLFVAHDVVGGNGSVRRGAERWKGPSTEGDQRSTLLRVGLAISLVTSHLLRSGIQFLVRRRFSGKNNHATLSLVARRNFWRFCGGPPWPRVVTIIKGDYRDPSRYKYYGSPCRYCPQKLLRFLVADVSGFDGNF